MRNSLSCVNHFCVISEKVNCVNGPDEYGATVHHEGRLLHGDADSGPAVLCEGIPSDICRADGRMAVGGGVPLGRTNIGDDA
jgi:hypothetical protein